MGGLCRVILRPWLADGSAPPCCSPRAPARPRPRAPRPGEPTTASQATSPGPTGDLPAQPTLAEAEAALAAGEPARAVALFAGYLAGEHDPAGARQAYPGLARAHEQLGDCAAAIRAYDEYLARFADNAPGDLYAARGACHAELEQWQASADDFAAAFTRATLPSAQVEALTRQGYAYFQLGEFDKADAATQASRRDLPRRPGSSSLSVSPRTTSSAWPASTAPRSTTGASATSPSACPRRSWPSDFARKFALLEKAQEGYNHTIKAKHMFWVSAAGYQLGALFEEFYDA